MDGFLWTAARFEGPAAVEKQYFRTREGRDRFVAAHPDWKRRGKICILNLEKHLEREQSRVVEE